MTSVTGVGRRGGLGAAALLLAAASLALAGCKTTGKEMAEEESTWNNPFAPKTFEEAKAMLPPLPQEANLIPFSVSGTGTLSFAVDSKSISVGKDNVVRYTVVTTSQSGARNVTFEGMRCDAFERKLYATLPPGAAEWVPNSSDYGETWHRMQTGVRNAYAATLAIDFFCEGRTGAGKPGHLGRALHSRAPRTRCRRRRRNKKTAGRPGSPAVFACIAQTSTRLSRWISSGSFRWPSTDSISDDGLRAISRDSALE